jgi:hypothetical protein
MSLFMSAVAVSMASAIPRAYIRTNERALTVTLPMWVSFIGAKTRVELIRNDNNVQPSNERPISGSGASLTAYRQVTNKV